ncbi:uncharacterized protein LOC123260520 [Cotesia glomerata]|uniref:uncharacterized protein LOC123260520 n=1 Tax=Cotesia glomerata TaxID=32391 RepID=UPI001D031F4E|nr:uncharacterized protein LOC123260520 [Cotesia glomerata]
MGKCCVPFCKEKATFTFPKDEKRRVLWEKAISVNFRSSKSSRLCSNHFEKDVIVEKNESYYTGIKSFRKTLKPNAVPTLMLELEIEKSKRSQKIREALFEDNSNDSNSSLCLSLLDNSPFIYECCSTDKETSLIDAPTRNNALPLLSNNKKKVSEHLYNTEHPGSSIQEDYQTSENLILSSVILDNLIIPDMSNISEVSCNIDIQMEEVVSMSTPEINQKDKVESTELKSSQVKQGGSSINNKKTYSSIGIQAGRGPLSVNSISHRDDVIHYYTGLGTYAKFQFVYRTLNDYVQHIKYVKGQVNCVEPEDMFLLTLMKLRRNIPDFGLSFYFGISEAVVRNIFSTWIHYIYQLWSLLDTWPSREVVDFYMPEGFKKFYPSTRVIVDATEMPIDKPSNPIAQQATFSTYKNKNTVKVLVGGTPDGILCYHSAAYGGSTSDRQIVERSNLIQKCQKGDSIMADRGFNVQDIFESQGVTINIPHFLKGKQLPSVTVLSDRKLASKRVHIERLIGLTKTYKILREPLNPSYTRLATKIFSICLMLCNFRESVVSSIA